MTYLISALDTINIIHDNKRYVLVRNVLKYQESSWEDAKNLCSNWFGGELLSLNTPTKLRDISNILTRLLITDGVKDDLTVSFWEKDRTNTDVHSPVPLNKDAIMREGNMILCFQTCKLMTTAMMFR